MEEACVIIENIVNAAMRKRDRFPLEWAGLPPSSHSPEAESAETIIWRANFAASNCYEGAKETVGFHSDRLTNLGPYPTIASLSLGTFYSFVVHVEPLTENRNVENFPSPRGNSSRGS